MYMASSQGLRRERALGRGEDAEAAVTVQAFEHNLSSALPTHLDSDLTVSSTRISPE